MIFNQYPISALMSFIAQCYGDTSKLLVTDQNFTLHFGAMTAGQPKTLPIQIPANSDFIVLEAGVDTTELLFSASFIQINDATSGDNFFSTSAPISAVCTIENSIVQFPWPRLVQGNSALYVTITPDATTLYDVSFSLLGVCVRKEG